MRGRETQNQVSKVNCYSTFLYVSVLCDKLCPIEQISSSSENIVQQFLIQLISKVNCYFFIFPDKSTALGTSCTDPNLFLAPIERDGDCLDLRVVVPPVLVEPAVDAQLHVVGQPVHAEPAAEAELLAAVRPVLAELTSNVGLHELETWRVSSTFLINMKAMSPQLFVLALATTSSTIWNL